MVWAGFSTGSSVPLDTMQEEYYTMMGWDTRGVPTQECLQDLGLEAGWSKTKQ